MDDLDKKNIDNYITLADALFERANKLENIDICKKDKDAAAFFNELKLESYDHCIQAWTGILNFLPFSPIDQSRKKELTRDAHKVISRCYQRLDNLESARLHIVKAIDNGYLAGFISLGAISMKLEKYQDAEDAFKSAILKDSMASRAYAGLGELYFALGTEALKKDPAHKEYFKKAEDAFIKAGKERFTDSFERAIDLFERVGLKDRALSVGESAVTFYEQHKNSYGEKLRSLDRSIRKVAGDKKHDKLVKEVGSKLRKILDKK